MKNAFALLLTCTAATTWALPAAAQDRRSVSEPTLPAKICATLTPEPGNRAAALQAALDRCGAGQAVKLAAGRYESGPLRLPSGVTLWLDRGATLAAIPDPKLYDDGSGACGTIDQKGRGCRPFIAIDHADHSAIVGDGTIDGQGGQPMAGGPETWWQLARRAQKENGKQNVPRLIVVTNARDITLYRVRLKDSANFHVAMNHVQGFTAWGVIVDTPADARNTDGIDPGAAEDVSIVRSFIRAGDDNVAIKAGNAGPTRHVSILESHFYSGHGMSIGSETNGGVSDVLVRGLSMDGTTSGLRIKSDRSRGGVVERVRYENICIRDVKRPIDIQTTYDGKAAGDLLPVYRDVVLKNVAATGGGRLIVAGFDSAHRLDIALDGARFDGGATWEVSNAAIAVGPGGAAPLPPGVQGAAPVSAPDCSAAFVAFPELR